MSGATGDRFYIRYAIQRWDDAKWFIGSFVGVLLALTIYSIAVHRSSVTYVIVLVIEVLFLLGLWTFRRTSYLEIGDEGLRLRYLLTRLELPFTAVTRVRKQPLGVAFQQADRRRYVNRFVRRLSRDPAAYIRIDRRERELIEEVTRRLGARMVNGADVILPITDVDAFVDAVRGRLRGGGG
jgi:hypothetical protein